ncbi:hypothetical protein D3C86_1266530 [compost metagenome]
MGGLHLIVCHSAVILGDRVVVGPLDDDGQAGLGEGSPLIAHAVAEHLGEGLAGQSQRLDLGVVIVNQVLVAAIGIEDELAIASLQNLTRIDAVAERVADGEHCPGLAIGLAVHVAVVVQHIADGIQPRRRVVNAAGFDGIGLVIHGNRRVVAAANGQGERAGASGAPEIRDLVVEELGQGLVRPAQGLHLGEAVVQTVVPAAIGIHHQLTIAPLQHSPQGGTLAIGMLNARHRQGIALQIAVIAEHIAAGIQAGLSVIESARLDHLGLIRVGDRGIVAPPYEDGELGKIDRTRQILRLVGEVVVQGLQGPQPLNGGIAGIEGILVTAILIQGEGAIEPGQGEGKDLGDGGQRAACGFSSRSPTAEDKAVAAVDVGIVAQQVAVGIDHIAGTIVGDGDPDVVAGHGGVVGPLNANGQGG